MAEVVILSYVFDLAGFETIHTEVRVFGFDWWFEKDGPRAVPSLEKHHDASTGYRLHRKIFAGFTRKTHNQFEAFIHSLLRDDQYSAEQYRLFENNCRSYSLKLLEFLDPDDKRDAVFFLQVQKLDAQIKRDAINKVGETVWPTGLFYFKFYLWLCLVSSFMGQPSPGNSCSGEGSSSDNKRPHSTTTTGLEQQQPGLFTQALDFALHASGAEKPKDTAGWAELFVRAKASVDRNTKKTWFYLNYSTAC